MTYFLYAADLYCEECGKWIREQLTKKGDAPENPYNENTYDSGAFPKGPYDDSDSSEADTAQHCGSGETCLDPTEIDGKKYGKFLENDLTRDGVRWLEEIHRDRPNEVTKFWIAHYLSKGYTINVE